MRISSVETILFTARWTGDPAFPAVPHSTAFVRIETDEGITGFGEALLGYFVPEAVPPLVDYFRPDLLGKDPTAIASRWQDLYAGAVWWARAGLSMSVISALEMALWDIRGKSLAVPVYELLGGATRTRVPVYASGGSALWPPQRAVEQGEFFRDRGYRAAKVSTGYYFEDDVSEVAGQRAMRERYIAQSEVPRTEADKVERLRDALGADFQLALDGHQNGIARPWSPHTALQVCHAVEDAGLLLFEEPLPYDDIPGYARLRRMTRVPIAGGESLAGIDAFERFLERDALEIVQPDVGWVGGIASTQKVFALAEARKARSAIHTGGAVGPGLAASLHLAAACGEVLVLEHVAASTNVQNLFFQEPLQVSDGTLNVPTTPGLGIELSADVLEAHPYVPGSGERS
jgi:L-alanine-DL-glutamate epimerase-like enolase superfamily enzyme